MRAPLGDTFPHLLTCKHGDVRARVAMSCHRRQPTCVTRTPPAKRLSPAVFQQELRHRTSGCRALYSCFEFRPSAVTITKDYVFSQSLRYCWGSSVGKWLRAGVLGFYFRQAKKHVTFEATRPELFRRSRQFDSI